MSIKDEKFLTPREEEASESRRQLEILRNRDLFRSDSRYPEGKLYAEGVRCHAYTFVNGRVIKELDLQPCEWQRDLNNDFVKKLKAEFGKGINYIQGTIVLVYNKADDDVLIYDGQHRCRAISDLSDEWAEHLDCSVTLYEVDTKSKKILSNLYKKINNYKEQTVQERANNQELSDELMEKFIPTIWRDDAKRNEWRCGRGKKCISEAEEIATLARSKNWGWRLSLRELKPLLAAKRDVILTKWKSWEIFFQELRDWNERVAEMPDGFLQAAGYSEKEIEQAIKHNFFLGARGITRVINGLLY